MRHQIVLGALASGALLFYSGSGLARLLAFDRVRGGDLLLLAPAAGAALLITVGSWTAVLGWSAGVALAIGLAAATIANVIALCLRGVRDLDVRASLGGVVLVVMVVAVGVAPLWPPDRTAAVIGRNGDQVFYTNIASYLERQGLPVPPPGPLEPAATQRSFIDTYGVPLGFATVHAMVDRLTGLPAYATFSVITAVLLALNVLACIFLAGRLFGLGRWWTLVAGALSAASPALMWIHYNNYAMHALSMGLAPAALGVAILALEEGRVRGLILAALLLSALCVSYPPAAGPFVLAPFGAYALLRAWGAPRPVTVLWRGTVLGLLVVALNLAALGHVAKVLRPMVGFILVREFGDVSSHVSPAHLLGLIHHALPEPPAWLTLPISVVTAVAAVLAAYGAAGTTPEGRRAFLAMLVTAVPFVLWLRFGLDYPYGFYKGLTFLVWPAVIAIVLGVRRALNAPAMVRAGAVALLLVLAGVSAVNLFRAARTVTVLDLEPMMELRALAGLVPRDQALHVRDESGTALLWLTYFLQDRSLYLGHDSPYYLHRRWRFYQESITAPLVLVNREALRLSPWDAGTVYENRQYRVARKDPAVLAYLDFAVAPRTLEADQELRVSFLPDRTVVDGRSFAAPLPTADGRAVALGLWAAGAPTLRVRGAGGERVLRPSGDREAIQWPASPRPSEAIIANAGAGTVLVPGWMAVVSRDSWSTGPGGSEGPLTILRDEVLPGSGFFTVDGWHGLEGRVRWSRGRGVAVFRNPRETSSLHIGCALSRPGFLEIPRIALLVNGRAVGRPHCSGIDSEVFALPETLLGARSWSMLEVRVDRVFVPRNMEVSDDERDLGILVRGLRLEPTGEERYDGR